MKELTGFALISQPNTIGNDNGIDTIVSGVWRTTVHHPPHYLPELPNRFFATPSNWNSFHLPVQVKRDRALSGKNGHAARCSYQTVLPCRCQRLGDTLSSCISIRFVVVRAFNTYFMRKMTEVDRLYRKYENIRYAWFFIKLLITNWRSI